MMERIEEVSPLLKARIAGALYLFTIVAGLSAVLLLHGRLAFAVNLVGGIAYMGVTLLLYYIFKPVNQGLSLIAAVFSLVGFVTGALEWKPLGVDSLSSSECIAFCSHTSSTSQRSCPGFWPCC